MIERNVRSIRTHTCYWHCPNFARDTHGKGRGGGVHVETRTFYVLRNIFTSSARCVRASRSLLFRQLSVIEIQRWGRKYTLAASLRKQMAYISDVETKTEGRKKKVRGFKHIRERCLENNHGTRKRKEGGKKERK